MSLLARFNAKFRKDDSTGCWVWAASTNGAGYGLIRPGGSAPRQLAHRVSYELFVGAIPSDGSYHGVCVLHRCDNPRCVNPEHLFLGSNLDNILDCLKKRRRPTKLTQEQVIVIRRRLASGESAIRLANEFRLATSTVKRIRARHIWKHLEAQNF